MAENNFLTEGVNYYNAGKYKDSLAFFLSLPDDKNNVSETDLAYYIGLCYIKLNRTDDALLYLEQVVTSGHNMQRILQCRFILAVIYAETGRKKLADFELGKLLETGYRTASVYSALAYVASEEGETEKSIDFYKKSLEIEDSNPTALNGLGYMLACTGSDLTKALSCCKKALEIVPNSAACLDSLGWIYYKLGLYKDAENFLSQAEKLAPENSIISDHIRKVHASEKESK